MYAEFRRLTRTEVATLAPSAVAVLPVGATEQHGLHLPVDVDATLVTAIARAAADVAGRSVDVVVCPTVVFGASHHHLGYPGALSLSTDTLLRVLSDLTDSLVASGFRHLFLLNGHGGNDECVRLAAREAAGRHRVSTRAASYWTMAWEALAADGRAFTVGRVPGHAGGFETSLMLHVAPDAVRLDATPPRRDDPIDPLPRDPAGRPATFEPGTWDTNDGYSDDARSASGDVGRAAFDTIVAEVARAIVDARSPSVADRPVTR